MSDVAAAAAVAASAPASGLSPMQAELLGRADAIFASVGSAVSKATDFAVEGGKAVAQEIPEIAFQYVAFGRAYNTGLILLGLAFFIGFFMIAYRYGFKNVQNAENDFADQWAGQRIFAVATGLLGMTVGFIITMAHLKEFLLVWFAPKVWLIMELVQLIKQVKS
jgi:hypothetical protein